MSKTESNKYFIPSLLLKSYILFQTLLSGPRRGGSTWWWLRSWPRFLSIHSITSDHLACDLAPCRTFLKACHFNAQYLLCYIDEVRAILYCQNFYLIGVSEAWLKPSIQSHEVAFLGYVRLVRDPPTVFHYGKIIIPIIPCLIRRVI